MFYCSYISPVGTLLMESNGNSLTGLWINGQKYFPSHVSFPQTDVTLSVFQQTKEWLKCYFNGEVPDFMPHMQLSGTPFQLSVWKILQQIPYGETVTYKEIANEIARQYHLPTMSAQAVGGAVGHNPISIIIPCHRVIGSNGSLTGYAGGIEKKLALLKLEGVNTARLKLPHL